MKDVHTEHCCIYHGCKYGYEMCSVVLGVKVQSYPCEKCSYETKEDQKKDKLISEYRTKLLELRLQLQNIREAAKACEKDPINAYDKSSSWEKLFNLLKLALDA